MTLLPRARPDGLRDDGVASVVVGATGRVLRSALLICTAVLPATAHSDEPPAEPPTPEAAPDMAKLRSAMERAFVAAEADHARARRDGFAARLDLFAPELRAAVAALAAAPPADAASRSAALGKLADTLAATASAPFSATSLRVVLAEMLPADPANWPRTGSDAKDGDAKDGDARAGDEQDGDEQDGDEQDGDVKDGDVKARDAVVRDAFLAAAKAVFAADRFPDCWDARFLDLPEVHAWRKAHEKKPGTALPPDPPKETAPKQEPESPPAKAAEPELPSPFATEPGVNLVPVDRTRGWVGPWTGWTQEIAERDNHRQRRPAKFIYVERYETTCTDYLSFLKSAEASKRRALLPVGWSIDDQDEPAFPPGRARLPVTNVTWFQATAYAESRGLRLPTEDEWERAAAGGEKEARTYPWGGDAAGKSWAFGGRDADAPVAVDAFPDDRTPEGIVGLGGNVSEMVATMADRRDVPSKLLPSQQVVVRGGSWRTPREPECSTTWRWVIDAGQPSPSVGFRCVMDEAEYKKRFK